MADAYKPVGLYRDAGVAGEDAAKLRDLARQWERAKAAGDAAAMTAAHDAAEAIRAGYGYSGGSDGTEYLPAGGGNAGENGAYSAAVLPSYRAREAQVNALYDAARDAEAQALERAYRKNAETLAAYEAAIPGAYQAGANAVAGDAERERQAFHEYAAASGLADGPAGQARLAMAVRTQGDLAQLRAAEAADLADAAGQRAALETAYRDAVAQALAEGEYKRAAALLDEYRTAEKSRVDTARDQADENYRAWQSGQTAAAAAEKQAAAEAAAALEAAKDRAAALAAYGDFSGYLALGYTQAETDAMRRVWAAKNPKLAAALSAGSGGASARRTSAAGSAQTAAPAAQTAAAPVSANAYDAIAREALQYSGNRQNLDAFLSGMVGAGRITAAQALDIGRMMGM